MTHKIFADVAAFHQAAAPHSEFSRFLTTVGMPQARQLAHVLDLLLEEHTELTDAMNITGNIPDTADAFLDIIYVCVQGLLSMGLSSEQTSALWDEVHRANMSKVDPACGLLAENDGKPYHTDTGKITKPPGFLPPDIGGLLNTFRRANQTSKL